MSIGGVSMVHFQDEHGRPKEVAGGARKPTHYLVSDSGCDLYARCLDCPLPRCRYDYTNTKELVADVAAFLGCTVDLRPRRKGHGS